jgi:1-aminocyclopropane-1-carboxylate deaminase/D-cysteine desulfhydrase-like pyridoxal-dependent ACC family enzyme
VAPETRIVGISVTTDRDSMRQAVRAIAEQLLEMLTIDDGFEEHDVIVFDEYLEPGYAILTPEVSRTIAGLARSHGVALDPVYTGKAWLGMRDLMETGFITRDESVVFIHTGGTAALFPFGRQVMGHVAR